MNSNSLLVASSGCSVYSIALFANSDHFTSSFPIWVPFIYLGFPRDSAGKESTCNAWETWVQYLGWEDPWRRAQPATPVLWPGEFHGLYSPWGHKESFICLFILSHLIAMAWTSNTMLNKK